MLGSLIEKEVTTPDYYPLSLNALVNACNQKSSREPVMSVSEDEVRDALQSLNQKGLAGATSTAESRVTKFEHRLGEAFNLGRPETAVFCVLLLRGPQTPGELRGRTERLYRFEDLDQVQHALERLIEREPPLVVLLPRHPGTKEARYAHLLSGEPPITDSPSSGAAAAASSSADRDRIASLEEQVSRIHQEISELKRQFAEFKQQFE